MTVNQLVRLGI